MAGYNATTWLLDRHVEEGRGSRTAIRCAGSALTYGELQSETFRAQHALDALAIAAGDRVVLVVNDEPAFPAWFLGAMRAGAVPVAVSTMLTADDLAAIVADAGARAVVVSRAFAEHLGRITTTATSVEHAVVIGGAGGDVGVPVHGWDDFDDRTELPTADTGADSPAFWLYSSGTTGLPKGVVHRHASPQATAKTYADGVLRITEDDRCLSIAKLFFAYGLGNSLTFPFAVGATAILCADRPTPAGMVELVETERPTLFFASPGFVAALLDTDTPADAFSSVRATVTAGEALPADLHRRFTERFGHPVLDGIGSTEALHIFISNSLEAQHPGTSGWTVPGYEARLLDDAGDEVVTPDTPGYLHVRGPSIASGYWERPEATAAAFHPDGWLRTGDVYTRGEDDAWTFLGRNNDMIKAGGIWVSPAEVESVLVEYPDVLEVAVVGDRNEAGLESVVAFVVAARRPRDRSGGHRRPLPFPHGVVQATTPCRRRRELAADRHRQGPALRASRTTGRLQLTPEHQDPGPARPSRLRWRGCRIDGAHRPRHPLAVVDHRCCRRGDHRWWAAGRLPLADQ